MYFLVMSYIMCRYVSEYCCMVNLAHGFNQSPCKKVRVTRLGDVSPNGAMFRPMNDCLLWEVTRKLRKYPTYLGYLFSWISLSINFDKKMGWATFWAIFSHTRLVLKKSSSTSIKIHTCPPPEYTKRKKA
jgi:hypothetical protein